MEDGFTPEKREDFPSWFIFLWGVITGSLTVLLYWEEYSTTGFETWIGSTPIWSIIISLPLMFLLSAFGKCFIEIFL